MPRPNRIAADHSRKCAQLEIGGKKYSLVYDFNAIAEAELLTGCNLLHGISAVLFGTFTAGQLRGLLYASLQPMQPYVEGTKDRPSTGVSLRQAGDMITLETLQPIYKALEEAWNLSLPEKKGNPPQAVAPPAES